MIQPHEITIGSLIRTNEGEIIRVETITSKAKHRKVGYHPKGRPTYMRYVRLAQCEGIKLTPELLEKNGWEYDEIDYAWEIKHFTSLYEHNNVIYTYWDGNEIVLYSIHQLQHALRLCGLNELADNIKI